MRYTVLKRSNGEVLIIDNVKVRLQHMRRRIFAWAKVTAGVMRAGVHMTMYGLTYDMQGTLGLPQRWEENDIRNFIIRLKARLGKRLKAYAWVAETTMKGRIHYHVVVVHTGRAPMPDRSYTGKNACGSVRHFERMWTKGVSHSDFNVRSPYYLVSYLKKAYQKDFEKFPKGAHAWAVWISDETAQEILRVESLDDYKRSLYYEVKEEYEGIGFRECWERFEWEVRRKKLTDIVNGKSWEYVGQVQSGEELRAWGVNDELLGQHVFTKIMRPV